jgi:hypothetical protein
MSWLWWIQNLGMGAGGAPPPPTGPATLREAVLSRLSDVPGLSELVGDRIYFASPSQGVSHSQGVVTFSVASRTFGRWLASPNRTSQARVRVSCWSLDELKAAEIADKIRAYFDGFQGLVGQVYFYYILLENEYDLPEPLGDGRDGMLYQVLLDFTVTHKVSSPDYS